MLRGGWEGNIILMVTYSGYRLVQLFFAKCSSQVLYNRFFFSSPMHAPPRRLDLNEMELLTVETAAECSFEWGKKKLRPSEMSLVLHYHCPPFWNW